MKQRSIVVIILLTLSASCSAPLLCSPPTLNPTTVLSQVIHSTDWVVGVLLISVVLGIFAGLNSIKMGWMGAAAAGAGLLIKSALSVTWVYWWCGFTLVAVMLTAVASIVLKNKALAEIITGVQHAKDFLTTQEEVPGSTVKARTAVNTELQFAESKPTKKLVQQHKAALRLKGKI